MEQRLRRVQLHAWIFVGVVVHLGCRVTQLLTARRIPVRQVEIEFADVQIFGEVLRVQFGLQREFQVFQFPTTPIRVETPAQ